MLRKSNIVCAIELGTSKICAIIAEISGSEGLTVLGYHGAPSGGVVVKGEIVNMSKACTILGQVLDRADKQSGGVLDECCLVSLLVTGCAISSQESRGNVTISSADGRVSRQDCEKAFRNAGDISIDVNRQRVNMVNSCYLLDNRRVANPVGMVGRHLEEHVHVVHGQRHRLETFAAAVRSYPKLENVRIEELFSPLACSLSVVDEAEGEKGVLLVDIGAGTVEYLVSMDNGICASGMLQVGMEHVANDLAIGLKLPIEQCRQLLLSGDLPRAVESQKEYLEFALGGTRRKILVRNCELIIEARLQEIFEIIRKELLNKKLPASFGAGGILTGGGANYFRIKDIFTNVFKMDCRVAVPQDTNIGANSINYPQFSAVWGALIGASQFAGGSAGAAEESIWAQMWKKLRNIGGGEK